MKSLLIVAVSLAFWGLTAQANPKKAETKAAAAGHCKKSEEHAGHKHGENCGHAKMDTHGHTHYEHTDAQGKLHHHVEHDGHYDECDKPHA